MSNAAELLGTNQPIHLESARKRFVDHLPVKPHCAQDLKEGLRILPRAWALQHPLIQLNGKLRFYLPFDVDREWAAFAYEDARLPAPTLTVINRQNAHAHLLYELEHPVLFPDRHGNGNARSRPMRFYKGVLEGMRAALGADPGYVGYICKNPLHPDWEVICHDHAVYSLEELCDYVDPIYPSGPRTISEPEFDPSEIIYEGKRNDTLFKMGRVFAYAQVDRCERFEELLSAIENYCFMINSTQMQPPLSRREVSSVARSIAKWTWTKRNSLYQDDRNRGAMGFEPMPWFDTNEEFIEEIRIRQSEGAKYKNELQRMETESRILEAIRQLKEANRRVTKAEVARRIGMHRVNITKRYSHLFSNG